ncbi:MULTISPECIES: MFS transporter [Rhizobium/Agrobacterium group]|jgi:MFS family permease|uniref:MFS transporter n=2 Tax=Rhizobium/Agrobacterium group TaxID=227290 RepID=A0A1B9UG06_AGRTU|nr:MULTISPECIES: MFS transporter [Rhizobium/Agrobacterium group]AHK02322.1 major facilitator family transporter [Agrobacterium tumefaciens LBA4213 (Ach5)]AKC08137.1 MFS permease [Agrobacterium tumefaciens]EHJ98994.1 sugar MFS permease [Agrobacterium tumefaciens 5A]MDP9561174.1 MFS family permease [Rhizobium nepotum]ADY65389.1 sugar MFS permease [Agrobacterium tumefaciens]
MANVAAVSGAARPMTGEEKKVIFASSLGTVFEWYDFYLYGSLAIYIGANFFSQYPETTRNIFALLAFAAGFLVRPFGALVFGRLGDIVGRKYTFLITILIMGVSTFLVGVLPGASQIGIAAPIILIILRMLQGLALGGEYGGAATYVAEHAPNGRRGYYTSWIQTTATLGLFLSLMVILGVQFALGKEAFAAWGWRIPFLVSVLLLGVSVWIRLKMNESPAFKKMKEEGKTSKAPLSEAFGQWKNAKIALLALVGAVIGQAVVWYTGQFYALFFLQSILKVDGQSANIMVAAALILGTGFFVLFGWLSDKIGRKPIIMAGLVLAMLTYFPLFKALTWAGNPALAQAQASVRATVTAAPGDCKFQFNPTGTAKFTTSCDIATSFLTRNSVPYDVVAGAAGTPASVKIGDATIASYDAIAAGADAAAKDRAFQKQVNIALHDGGYPLVRGVAQVPDAKLDAFIAANPELNLNAEAVRAADKKMVATDKLVADKLLTPAETAGAAEMAVYSIAGGGTFAMVADPAAVNWVVIIAVLTVLVIYVTMVYGPIAALLVELFPTRIRYSGMSLPYHIGNGWFGGLLPATAFAMSAAKGDIYYGLWYPIVFAGITLVIGLLFLPETKDRDIHTME